MKTHSQPSSSSRAFNVAFLAAALATAQFSLAQSPSPSAPPPSGSAPAAQPAPATGGPAGTNSKPLDRHDTIRSNEQRLNTVGKDVNAEATKVSRPDRRFIEKAARGGQNEVRLAKLAVSHATDPRIRSFAQQIVTDHEKANAELNELAGKKGVSMPADEDDRFFRSISDVTGSDFDKKFISHMADEHEDDIDLFEKTSRKADDPEVAAYASKQLAALQEHHRMAQELEQALKK